MKALYLLSLFSILLVNTSFAQNEIISEASNLIEAKQYAEAVTLLENSTSQYPDNEKLLELLGRSYSNTDDFGKAMDTFSDLTKMDKTNAEYFFLLGESSYEALSNTSNIFKLSTYSSRMKSSLSKALELDPSHVGARIRLSNYYLNAPMIAGGSTKKALEHAKILVQYDPNAGNQLLASIHIKNEEHVQAEAIYLKMIEDNIDERKLYYLLAVLKTDQEQFESAMDYCEQSIATHPDYLTAYYQYGKAATRSGNNLEKALFYLNYFVENHSEGTAPSLHWAHLRIGQIHQLNGDKEEARKEFNTALALKPDFNDAKSELKRL